MAKRSGPAYKLTFEPEPTPAEWKTSPTGDVAADPKPRPKVCVLRQEGSNGDREMLSAFHEGGLEAWDVNMNDLLQGVPQAFLYGTSLGRLWSLTYASCVKRVDCFTTMVSGYLLHIGAIGARVPWWQQISGVRHTKSELNKQQLYIGTGLGRLTDQRSA